MRRFAQEALHDNGVAPFAVEAEVRLYGPLFTKPDPDDVPEGADYRANLNPESRVVLKGCRLEPSLASASPEQRYQFERLGYFRADPVDSRSGALVFNRTVTLRDSYAKIEKAQQQKKK